jgi:hypothetical protein
LLAIGAASVAQLRIAAVSRKLGRGTTERDQSRLAYGNAGRDLLRSVGKGWVQSLQWGKLGAIVFALVIIGARLSS